MLDSKWRRLILLTCLTRLTREKSSIADPPKVIVPKLILLDFWNPISRRLVLYPDYPLYLRCIDCIQNVPERGKIPRSGVWTDNFKLELYDSDDHKSNEKLKGEKDLYQSAITPVSGSAISEIFLVFSFLLKCLRHVGRLSVTRLATLILLKDLVH